MSLRVTVGSAAIPVGRGSSPKTKKGVMCVTNHMNEYTTLIFWVKLISIKLTYHK